MASLSLDREDFVFYYRLSHAAKRLFKDACPSSEAGEGADLEAQFRGCCFTPGYAHLNRTGNQGQGDEFFRLWRLHQDYHHG